MRKKQNNQMCLMITSIEHPTAKQLETISSFCGKSSKISGFHTPSESRSISPRFASKELFRSFMPLELYPKFSNLAIQLQDQLFAPIFVSGSSVAK